MGKSPARYVCSAIFASLVLLASSAESQSLIPNDDGLAIVMAVKFDGELKFSNATHSRHVRTRPNRDFLGIPGMPLWLWMYSLGEAGCCFGNRIEKTLVESGEPPAFLDSVVLDTDAERLAAFYRREGFLDAVVYASVDTLSPRLEVRVTFHIEAGAPTFIRTLEFDGLDPLTPDQQRRLAAGSKLGQSRDEHTPLRLSVDNKRYSESSLVDERRRLVAFLRDEGYARVTRDSIRAYVTSVSPDSFDVRIAIKTGSRYRFGNVNIFVEGPEIKETRIDTLVRPGEDSDGYVIANVQNEGRLDPSTLLKAMYFRPGDWFNESKLLATKRRMEGIGIFTFTDFVPQWNNTELSGPIPVGLQSPTSTGVLPYSVELQTRRRHQLRIESFLLQRTAVLGDETSSGEIGVGLGTTYRNASLLGGGELFQLRAAGSIAADVETFDPFQSSQAEVELSLTYPYLWGPFRGLDRSLNLYEARSRVGFKLLTARRESVFLVIHARASFNAALEMKHSETLTSFLRLLEFDLSDPDTLKGFGAQFLDPIDDPVEKERVLEDYTRPQVNSSVRYTVRASDTDLFLRERGHIHEATFEIGGNIPFLLDRFVFTPDTLEGTIPGIPIFRREGVTNDLVYRQYFRFVLDTRRYKPVGFGSVVAYKAIIGLAQPVGKADVVPFDRRFYSGGSSSNRAWRLRELGPGAVTAQDSIITGGDIKIEASVEARTIVLRNLMKANWITAIFVDAGNVWYGPRNPGQDEGRFRLSSFYKQIGIGAGFGFRLGWDYLILRFDLGFKIHDPVRGFFSNSAPRFHFGIGHAF